MKINRGNTAIGILVWGALIWGAVALFGGNDESEYDYTPTSSYSSYSSYGDSYQDYEDPYLEESAEGGSGEIYYSNGGNEDFYIYSDCVEGDYCYAEDESGDEREIYVHELDGGYGYGEDEYGNEVEFTY